MCDVQETKLDQLKDRELEPVLKQRRKAKQVAKEFSSLLKFTTQKDWRPCVQKFLATFYA